MKKSLFLPIPVFILVFLVAWIGQGTASGFDLSCFRICLVQMDSGGSKTANLAKIDYFAARAAAQGAVIVCFPELSISGYDRVYPEMLAESIPGDATTRVLQMAARYHIVILAGLIESAGNNLYISQIAAFPDQRIEKYRKTHPGRLERAVFSAGQSLPVFRLTDALGQEVIFGMGLCYDMHFPEVATAYSLKGAHIVFSPHASPLGGMQRISVWNRYLGARAYDNTLYVAACNHVVDGGGKGGGMGVWGYRSAAPVCEYHGTEEKMLFCDLGLTTLNRHRQKNSKIFYLKDRRSKLYMTTDGLQP
jgi:predicted amidohydrolase